MLAFVTVGSTHFDALIDSVLSIPVLNALKKKGYDRLVVQCGAYGGADKLSGNVAENTWSFSQEKILIEVWRYKPTLKDEISAADLVISHAGKLSYNRVDLCDMNRSKALGLLSTPCARVNL